MKKQMMNYIRNGWLIMSVLTLGFLSACTDDGGEDPEPEEVVASFQFAVDETDFLKVTFTNFSQNATSYSWDFGDDGTSIEENPTHTYAAGGTYEVTLTATNDAGESATRSENVTVTNPDEQLILLAGTESKTWKLFREGTSMSLGASADAPTSIWAGLTNDGSRPCLYEQTITFNVDGSYTFDDKGVFWAEYGVFNNVADEGCDVNVVAESCMDISSGTLVNACGDDVSAWLGGTHSYTYNTTAGEITLEGEGAWIGVPKLGTDNIYITPQSSVTFSVTITEEEGYDVMEVVFNYADIGNYWPIYYVSYSDASLEPELVTEKGEFGTDLEDITPSSLSHTFASAEDFTLLGTLFGGSIITPGADDPAGGEAKVGQFARTDAQYQEAQMQVSPAPKDIQFDDITTISLDVYMPSTNDHTGTLTKQVIVGLADQSQTEQWWTDIYQWETEVTEVDTWTTVTFDITTPTFDSGNGNSPKDRTDLDMFYIQIGGGNHTQTGTFYIRNLVIE